VLATTEYNEADIEEYAFVILSIIKILEIYVVLLEIARNSLLLFVKKGRYIDVNVHLVHVGGFEI
jgi:hypothetical protein